MTVIKNFHFLLLFTVASFCCKAQSNNKVRLSKLIFHLSRCNGLCPKFDIDIDSIKNISVYREYFETKSEINKEASGQFKGVLTDEEFKKLLELLRDVKLETLTFPKNDMVDAVETTIIVYYNGLRKYLKSSEPPIIANKLISYLTLLGSNTKLKRVHEVKKFEF
jgi:hypothetical protein